MASPPITPLPLTTLPRHILLVGGTFDPPHLAHAQMAQCARRAIHPATHIALVPAARSPFKPPPRASDADRIAMLHAMADALPGSSVWTDEIDRARSAQPSYWVHTLQRAHEALADRLRAPFHTTPPAPRHAAGTPTLHFLIGADQAIALHRWREARRILELARPAILPRDPITTPDLLAAALRDAHFWAPGEIDFLTAHLIPCDLSPISATAIRAQLAHDDPAALAHLHPAVARVIQSHRLYRP